MASTYAASNAILFGAFSRLDGRMVRKLKGRESGRTQYKVNVFAWSGVRIVSQGL